MRSLEYECVGNCMLWKYRTDKMEIRVFISRSRATSVGKKIEMLVGMTRIPPR